MTSQQNAADDARAALAAAAHVIGMAHSPGWTLYEREKYTLTMADGFLRWLQRNRRGLTTVEPGDRNEREDRLTPGVDFRSPANAPTQPLSTVRPEPCTHRVAQPSSVAFKIMCVCGVAYPCSMTGNDLPHELSPVLLTPSGRRACFCGQSWPCSQRKMPDHAEEAG